MTPRDHHQACEHAGDPRRAHVIPEEHPPCRRVRRPSGPAPSLDRGHAARRARPGATIAALVVAVIGLMPAAARAQDRPGSSLDLQALVHEALANHPGIHAARDHRASLAEVPSQVSSYPDPMAMTAAQNFRADDFRLGGSPMTGIVFGIHQGIPFPGKLSRRRDVAERRVTVADRQIGSAETALELRVRMLYWELHYAERAAALTRDDEKVFDTLTDVVHARYGLGQGAQQDALQAEVALSRLNAKLQARLQAVTSAQRALSSAVGRPPDATLAPTARPPEPGALLSREALRQAALAHNPDLRIGGAEIAAASAAVAEARRDRYPDFGLDLGYRLRAAAPGDPSNGADMVSLSLSVNLPVWIGRKQDARVRQRRWALAASRDRVAALTLDVENTVAREVDAIERLEQQIATYRKEVLPESDQALDASISDYQVGSVNFVSVLDNWRTHLDVRIELERLIADRAERLAELRARVGAPVEKEKP